MTEAKFGYKLNLIISRSHGVCRRVYVCVYVTVVGLPV